MKYGLCLPRKKKLIEINVISDFRKHILTNVIKAKIKKTYALFYCCIISIRKRPA